jgi:hypothetical protein
MTNPTTIPVTVNFVTSDVWRLIEVLNDMIEINEQALKDEVTSDDVEAIEGDKAYLNEIKTKLEEACLSISSSVSSERS